MYVLFSVLFIGLTAANVEASDGDWVTGNYPLQAPINTARMLQNLVFKLEPDCSDNLELAIPEAEKVIKFVISAMQKEGFKFEDLSSEDLIINSINKVIQEGFTILEDDFYLHVPQNDQLINVVKNVLKKESVEREEVSEGDEQFDVIVEVVLANAEFVEQVAQAIVQRVVAICDQEVLDDEGISIVSFEDSKNLM
eukprot:TRINITY_DN20696_c0_g3_i1.p1 TRINITY_DN20696_c0_g3~~TRINITY_DN20696_c0_g3_i1.p1  ORF type:complete len:196 (+),score=36.81 TRINITY_DN20696_c0_g3_i1:181-768(+)